MLASNGKLKIFEDFHVDRNLPKFAKTGNITQGANFIVQGNAFTIQTVSPPKFFARLWYRICSLFRKRPALTIVDFFVSVKNSTQEIELVKERAAGYEAAMADARLSGQTALLEQLEHGLNAFRQETQLFAIGSTKYLKEEDIIAFYKASPRGLRLDYVKNFTRPIPKGIISTKQRADELGIFDNYVVLHYDPGTKAYSETKAEKEARKDPILFGTIEGKRRLYFVGDWVDEVCDLTLDQIADKLGADVIQTIS